MKREKRYLVLDSCEWRLAITGMNSFPYMEDLQAYEAIVEYAGVTDSRSLIKLADHIDDFEFYPGVYDTEDVAREWLSNQPYLQLSAELEEYYRRLFDYWWTLY